MGEEFKTCRDDVWLCWETDWGWGDYRKQTDFDCGDIEDKEIELPKLSHSHWVEKGVDREKIPWEAVISDIDL